MGSQLQCGSKPQHYCTYCLAGYRCCSNCHSFRLLRSLPKNREKNRLNLIFHIFNGRCAFLPYGLVCCAFLILFLVFCYLQLAECLFCSSLFLIIYRIGRIICCHSNNFIISKNTLPLGQRAFIQVYLETAAFKLMPSMLPIISVSSSTILLGASTCIGVLGRVLKALLFQPFFFFFALRYINSFNLKDNRSCSVVTASYHHPVIICPTLHTTKTALASRLWLPMRFSFMLIYAGLLLR